MDRIDIANIQDIAYSGEEKIDSMYDILIFNNIKGEFDQFDTVTRNLFLMQRNAKVPMNMQFA